MPALGEIVREKVADGRLPELPILAAQAEYEFEDDGATYRFHIGCYGFWEAERRRRGGGGTTRGGAT